MACNHASILDPVVAGIAVRPRKLNFMAKVELFKHPFSSWWLNSVGVVPVKRDSADFSALREVMRRIKQGKALLLFPEGRRSKAGENLPAQAGIGFLAAKLEVPVIPALIKGTEIALPRETKKIKPARISVCFGEQILFERRMPYQDIANLIMEKIRHLAC